MKFKDVFQWTTVAIAAVAILPSTAASALTVYGGPGAGDTSWRTTNAQAIDRVAWGPCTGGIVLAGEEELYSDDDSQPPEMDDPGTGNPAGTDDDDDGDFDYAGGDSGGACGPGWRSGADGWFPASG